MNDSDRVGDIGNSFQNVDVLNLSGAFHFQFGLTSLRLGGAVPLRDREEKLFDAEVIAQLSQAF